ncbi:MAG: glycosyltransferase family 9 protein [Thiohalomonadales bacterium]
MFSTAPDSLCILRLSAVGDICHSLPVVRTIQSTWPNTQLSWIIGKSEASLIGDIPGITFIPFDKSGGLTAYRDLYKRLSRQKFDALLHMQMSLRSSMVNRLIGTDVRIGFDRARAKDLQRWFNNHEIPAHKRQHVLDSFFGFSEALGIQEKLIKWDIPLPAIDIEKISQCLGDAAPYVVISPCSAMAYRNWHCQGYAEVCDYITERGITPILTGGPSTIERTFGKRIAGLARHPVKNLIGKTSLKQLLVVLKSAVGVISPDSGPAHMATTVHTPVIGLYACTNPDRARPYLSKKYTVNKYDEAILAKYAKTVEQLPWGIRVKDPGTMDRISVKDVTDKLDLLFTDQNLV